VAARFLLIDPSIEDLRGHYHDYAVSVLQAAQEAGYQALLATSRRFRPGGDHPWPVYRQFEYGLWSESLRSVLAPALGRLIDLIKVAAGKTGRPAARDLGSDGLAPETTRGRWGSLCDRWLYAPLVRLRRLLNHRAHHQQFAWDLSALLHRVRLGPGDHVFLPTVSRVELEGLYRHWRTFPHERAAAWHLLFRRDPPGRRDEAEERRLLLRAFGRFHADCAAGRIRFYTDTEALSRAYQEFTSLLFQTLPIPHTAMRGCQPPFSAGPLRILYLGDARMEKGYHYLPDLIRDLWPDLIATGRVAFIVQSNPTTGREHPEITAARARLAALAGPSVRLLETPLSPEEYRQILQSGHVALLLYDRGAYQARSSGILAEALAAGVPPIVPAETWLAQQLAEGKVGRTFHDVREVPGLIRELVYRYDHYCTASEAFAARWSERHNAARLVAAVTEPAPTTPPIRGRSDRRAA
jgi:hypothetical protein